MILLSARYVSNHGVQRLAMAPVGPILADIRSHSVGYPIRQGRNSTTTVQAALTLDGFGILGLPATHSSLSDPAGPTAGQSSWQGCMQGRETPGPSGGLQRRDCQCRRRCRWAAQEAIRSSTARPGHLDPVTGSETRGSSLALLSCSPVSLLHLPPLRQLVQAQVI